MSQAVLDDGDTFLYLGSLLLSTLILIIFFHRYSILAKMGSRMTSTIAFSRQYHADSRWRTLLSLACSRARFRIWRSRLSEIAKKKLNIDVWHFCFSQEGSMKRVNTSRVPFDFWVRIRTSFETYNSEGGRNRVVTSYAESWLPCP